MKSEKTPDSRRLLKPMPGSIEAARVYNLAFVADAEAGEKPFGQNEVYGEVRM
jgi:hypothetical protein